MGLTSAGLPSSCIVCLVALYQDVPSSLELLPASSLKGGTRGTGTTWVSEVRNFLATKPEVQGPAEVTPA